MNYAKTEATNVNKSEKSLKLQVAINPLDECKKHEELNPLD